MVNINHSSLTDPYLHEPKGVASATNGSIYVANGSGSGSWVHAHHYVGGYVPFNATTPMTQAVSTTFSPLDPTFSLAENSGFTAVASPNARLVYLEPEAIIGTMNFSCSIRHAAGAKHNVELAFYINGTVLDGSHTIVTTGSSDWVSVTLTGQKELAQNDYLEVWVKADTSLTIEMASAFLNVSGTFKE